MRINLYKLHYLSSHFSTQPKFFFFYPPTFPPILIFYPPLDNFELILVSNKKRKINELKKELNA